MNMNKLRHSHRAFRLSASLAIACAFWAIPARAANPPAAPRAFDTPQQAADALVKAAEAGDMAAVDAIFGAEGKGIVSSGDPVADKNSLAKFAEHARQKMDVTFDVADPKLAIVVVGSEDWPMPVPIVEKNGKWRFNAKMGRQELLARRIGGNELDAIALLRGYVDAQWEYASEPRDGSGVRQYAQKWVSTPGTQDGLSWRDTTGNPAGPMGDEIAKALAAGYTKKSEPYNGYYFRTLTAQGPVGEAGRPRLRLQGNDDRRLRRDRLARQLRRHGRPDLRRQQRRRRLPEGPRPGHGEARPEDQGLQPGQDLDRHRRRAIAASKGADMRSVSGATPGGSARTAP